ncbi:MAG: hypothetical protein K0R90_1407, partial [Oscillospiraceae bacterium]|nr:hypothetical protein [Oscillospiraceae bacterium]
MNMKLIKFNNPLYQGQDPFIAQKDGFYYLVASSNDDRNCGIFVSKSKTLIDQGEKICVFDSKGTQKRMFAPEIFFINGKWFIYYCADYECMNWRHHAGCLESVTDDPQGEYIDHGVIFTGEDGVNQQANDFTVFFWQGELYACWGTMNDGADPKCPEGPAIAKMDNPYTITQNRSFLPEQKGEGPRALIHDDKLFITVSDGGFACLNYNLGMYVHKGGDVLRTENWEKTDHIFHGNEDVYSTGRASFVKSADMSEDWVVYHSKVYPSHENGWRNVNIQKFDWNEDGSPNFGEAVSVFEFQDLPSGDAGLGDIYSCEQAEFLGGEKVTVRGAQSEHAIRIDNKLGSYISFKANVDEDGEYFVRSRYSNG